MTAARLRRWRMAAWLALLAAVSGVVALPFLRADRYRDMARRKLEEALGSRVEINGAVRYSAFTRPGLSLEDVVIHDVAAFGAEPVIYAGRVDIALRPQSLPRGRFEIAAIYLQDASINITRRDEAGWNILALFERVAAGPKSGSAPVTSVVVEGSRLNLKVGDVKSIFYLSNADIEFTAADRPHELQVRYSGEPARTDFAARGYGSLSGSGKLRVAPGREPEVEMGLTLNRFAIAELSAYTSGTRLSVGGFVAARTTLRGPLSAITIEGSLQLDEIERWKWLTAGTPTLAVEYRGRLDLIGGTVELATRPAGSASPPLAVRLQAGNLLSSPVWTGVATLRAAPAASLLRLARETGTAFPAWQEVGGTLSGAVGYSPRSGWQGQLKWSDGVLKLAGGGELSFDELSLQADGGSIRIPPSPLRVSPRHSIRASGRFDWPAGRLQIALESAGLPIAVLENLWTRLAAGAPSLLDGISREGLWSGKAEYRHEPPQLPHWEGVFTLRQAVIAVDGLAQPLRVESANVVKDSRGLSFRQMRGRIGGERIEADCQLPSRKGTSQLHVTVQSISLDRLAALLEPAFQRDSSFLSRTLQLANRAAPEWVARRNCIVAGQIGELSFGDQTLRHVRFRAYWEGVHLYLRDIVGEWMDGTLSAELQADLSADPPRFTGKLHAWQLSWAGGAINAGVDFQSRGWGQEFWRNLRAGGLFTGAGWKVGGEETWDRVWGSLEWSGRANPPLDVREFTAVSGRRSWSGNGAMFSDGRLHLLLEGGGEPVRVAGKLAAWRLELARSRQAPGIQ